MLKRVCTPLFNGIFLAAFSLLIFTSAAQSAVWDTTSNWSPDWERAYQNWVATKWNKNFFLQPGFFQNVTMDCADTVYSMRLIFAAQNGLSFTMADPTGSGSIISNKMTRWDRLPPEDRKRAFLLFIYDMAGTSTLPADSYPVAISRETIGSGRFLLTDPGSHHSWTIKFVSDEGVPFLLFASRPARTTLFERFEYPTVPFIFPKGIRPETNAGFRMFRYAQDLNKPVWEVPGYSLEQYQLPASSWSSQIQRRLAVRNETYEQRLSRILENACRDATERADVVSKGDRLNQSLGDACMDQQQFDDYSTPSKDTRFKASLTDLASTYARATRAGARLSPKVQQQVESVVRGDAGASAGAYCTIRVSSRYRMTLGQIYERLDFLSSNPHDTIGMRWGFETAPSAKAQQCPEY